ncbi:MAG: hypothetical protein F6J87_09110 [Spirulina sp. SIO3F2]|nr:hypothetical protein [Spirulina sp. SIO3F2]
MNKFILEPTDENLERLKRSEAGKVYWHTKDFFWFDPAIENELATLLETYMDVVMESEEDDDKVDRRLVIVIGRMLVELARKVGTSAQDCRNQFDNFIAVIWTPICIWHKDESGKIRYSLKSKL